MSHASARLTPMGRLLIIQRIQGGMPQAHVAAQMSLSRATVAKWWKRWQADGEPGLVDRSSRPHRSPRRTEAAVEAKVCRLAPDQAVGAGAHRRPAGGAGVDGAPGAGCATG